MAWVLEAKGYHCDDSNQFTAIIPIWSGYSRHYYLPSVNHIKITGVTVRIDSFDNTKAYWHPDNCYSAKWIEVILKLCRWELNNRDQYVISKCHNLGSFIYIQSYKSPLWKYYVKASEMQKIADDIVYKSKDRENEEAQYYLDAWNNMHSSSNYY